MKDTTNPDKRRKYDAAFRAEALRLAEHNRSAQAAAWALNIDPKRIYQWQKAAQTPVAAALGATLDPATAVELRQLRALDVQSQGVMVYFSGWNFARIYGTSTPRQRPHHFGNTGRYPT